MLDMISVGMAIPGFIFTNQYILHLHLMECMKNCGYSSSNQAELHFEGQEMTYLGHNLLVC